MSNSNYDSGKEQIKEETEKKKTKSDITIEIDSNLIVTVAILAVVIWLICKY